MSTTRKRISNPKPTWLRPKPSKLLANTGFFDRSVNDCLTVIESHSTPTTPSVSPRKNKCPGHSPIPEESVSIPIFSSGTLSSIESMNVVEFIGRNQDFKRISIFKKINYQDQLALMQQHPVLARKLIGEVVKNEVDVPILGKGTFCFVLLGKDEHGKFYAVREILDQQELTSNIQDGIARGQVLFDTSVELEIQRKLKEAGLDDVILLAEDAVLMRADKKIQIYQFLPLADLGNGRDVMCRIKNLSSMNKEVFFDSVASQLLQSMMRIHAENVAMNDIKPENILFTSKGLISFSDFGSACHLNSQGRLQIASDLKDVSYLAPYANQMPNCSDAEKMLRHQRQDLWSLALTILAFKDPCLIQGFIEAVIPRRCAFVAANKRNSDLAFSGDIEKLVGTADASSDCYISTEYMPDESVTLSSIYHEELNRHIFQSASFLSLSSEYQGLFARMLDVDLNEPNLTIGLKELMEDFNSQPLKRMGL